MHENLDAIAFDLDGTLYPNYRFYSRLLPFALKEQRLFRAFGKARSVLHALPPNDPLLQKPFYEAQARLVAEILGTEAAALKEKIEQLIYRGWEPLFKKVRLFSSVRETLAAFKAGGLKLGLLSDFPPHRKLEYLKLTGLWDTVICSEVIGRLKPDPASFRELARSLGTQPERVLYVGNSVRYDVAGAKNAGMQTALKTSFFLKTVRKPRVNADFTFSDYRQLLEYVLE
jgi:putative hydrolase of the HAD superfamily